MPIEFDCPACGDLIRTPEGTAGKRGQCPFCQHVFTIPQRSAPVAALPVRIGSDGKLEFSCLGCGQLVRVPTSAGGKRGQCPHCQIIVQIPAVPAPDLSANLAASLVDGDVEFHCPQCHEAVRTPAEAVGKRGMCPHCEATFVIPAPQADSHRSLNLDSGFELTVPKANRQLDWPSDQQRKEKTRREEAGGSQIEFDCPTCSRKFRIPATLAGKKGRCPKCNTSILIPALDQPATARNSKSSGKPSIAAKTSDQLKPLKKPASTTTGLTPLEDVRALTAADRSAGLVPLDTVEGLTPIHDAVGLTPLDDSAGLTPIVDSAGLTPISQTPGLTPLPATGGLTPIHDPIGLTPLGPAKTVRAGDVDDGRTLIPLREPPQGSSSFGQLPPPTNIAITITFIGLLIAGTIQAFASLILIFQTLNQGLMLPILFMVATGLGLLQIFGGMLLRQRRSYGWCIAACVAALFNPCLGIPFGILGLFTLANARDTFLRGGQ